MNRAGNPCGCRCASVARRGAAERIFYTHRRRNMSKQIQISGAFFAVALIVAGGFCNRAAAATVDLTTAGASGTINGALYQQNTSQPSGTGFIDSFLRIEKTGGGGAEQGYNTDFRPVEFDEKTDHNFTRSIKVSDVPTVTINNTVYRQFFLDVNEPSSQAARFISMDQFDVYLSSTGSPTNYTANPNNLGERIYSMDAGADSTVKM